MPKFGGCSAQLRLVNATAYARRGFRLAEVAAYENPKTGCIEGLVQKLVLPGAAPKYAILKSDPRLPHVDGLAAAGRVALEPGRFVTGVGVHAAGDPGGVGCTTKIAFDTRAPSAPGGGRRTVALRSSAHEDGTGRPVARWPAKHYVAALHMRVLKYFCAASSGFPLMQVMPSSVVPSAATAAAAARRAAAAAAAGAAAGTQTAAAAPAPPR